MRWRKPGRFGFQIAGERFWVPERAQFSVEHERGEHKEEVEFPFKWALVPEPEESAKSEHLV